jgi:hypothetical protein
MPKDEQKKIKDREIRKQHLEDLEKYRKSLDDNTDSFSSTDKKAMITFKLSKRFLDHAIEHLKFNDYMINKEEK